MFGMSVALKELTLAGTHIVDTGELIRMSALWQCALRLLRCSLWRYRYSSVSEFIEYIEKMSSNLKAMECILSFHQVTFSTLQSDWHLDAQEVLSAEEHCLGELELYMQYYFARYVLLASRRDNGEAMQNASLDLSRVLDRFLSKIGWEDEDQRAIVDALRFDFDSHIKPGSLRITSQTKNMASLCLAAKVLKGMIESSDGDGLDDAALTLCWLQANYMREHTYDHLLEIGLLFMAGLILGESRFPSGSSLHYFLT